MSKRYAALSLVACALIASGCSHEKEIQRLCPQVAMVRDLQQIYDYGQNTPAPSELVAVSAMQKIEGDCSYSDKGADVHFTLSLAAAKGPRLGGDKMSFPFFVALLDPSGKIVKKDMLTTNVAFASGEKRVDKQEELHVFIPLPDPKASAEGYRILTGFQLTQDQIEAVRQEKADAFKEKN